MKRISVLIVDDEPLARERLKRMLADHAKFAVVGEASHGEAALQWLAQQSADLVLLDIQMPGQTGLQVAEQLTRLAHPPLVVFCTAYDEHAIAAFKVNAIDYLLKPVRPDDLASALARVKERLVAASASPTLNPQARTHLSANTHKGLELVSIDSISACLAEQKYVRVLHEQGETLVDESLKQLEEEFSDYFLRAHRNALVAKKDILRLEVLASGGHQLRLKSQEQSIPVSRRQLAEIRQILKNL